MLCHITNGYNYAISKHWFSSVFFSLISSCGFWGMSFLFFKVCFIIIVKDTCYSAVFYILFDTFITRASIQKRRGVFFDKGSINVKTAQVGSKTAPRIFDMSFINKFQWNFGSCIAGTLKAQFLEMQKQLSTNTSKKGSVCKYFLPMDKKVFRRNKISILCNVFFHFANNCLYHGSCKSYLSYAHIAIHHKITR